jgi:predicted short-subunit dehydrogenase-like oxidoreductase (DUF2520 family)
MDIVLIGSGNTATVLGRASFAAGHRILQVYSRKEGHANLLASRLDAKATSSISNIERKADLTIIALKDEALASFKQALGNTGSLLAHTAGAISIQAVRQDGGSYGVLYPLQSLRKEIESVPPLILLVDGNDSETTGQLKKFASTIAQTVVEANDDERLKYHLAATLVNNFTNHLFALADAFCQMENISFSVLQPLMEETVRRLRNTPAASSQTGAAFRNDEVTLKKHQNLLKEYPSITRLYDLFTEEIPEFHKPKV